MSIRLVSDARPQITFFAVDADRRRYPYLNENTWRCRGTTDNYRKGLATLRLVSKCFNQSASPVLFRHFNATVGVCSRTTSLENLVNVSSSANAANVRNLEVLFRFLGETDHQYLLQAVAELVGVLPGCLTRFPNLKALHFNFQVPRCPRRLAEVFRDTVITALRYTPLSKLTELDTGLPIAYDFGLLLDSSPIQVRIPIENVLRRLRHLSLCISEWTSDQDQRYYFRPVFYENAALPNPTYAKNLCKMVELAENLESLAVDSKDIINVDNMNLHKSIRLKTLSLERVSISAHVLISLIDQCENNITSIEFSRVELTSGTWENVLVRISRLSKLLNFWVVSGGYSRDGTSSHLRASSSNFGEDIETSDVLDTYALGND